MFLFSRRCPPVQSCTPSSQNICTSTLMEPLSSLLCLSWRTPHQRQTFVLVVLFVALLWLYKQENVYFSFSSCQTSCFFFRCVMHLNTYTFSLVVILLVLSKLVLSWSSRLCVLILLQFVEPMPVQQVYPLYPQRTEGMTAVFLQHNYRKVKKKKNVFSVFWTGHNLCIPLHFFKSSQSPNVTFLLRQNQMFPHSRVHLKPKYRRYIHHKEYHYLPEATAPPDASMHHTQPPLM